MKNYGIILTLSFGSAVLATNLNAQTKEASVESIRTYNTVQCTSADGQRKAHANFDMYANRPPTNNSKTKESSIHVQLFFSNVSAGFSQAITNVMVKDTRPHQIRAMYSLHKKASKLALSFCYDSPTIPSFNKLSVRFKVKMVSHSCFLPANKFGEIEIIPDPHKAKTLESIKVYRQDDSKVVKRDYRTTFDEKGTINEKDIYESEYGRYIPNLTMRDMKEKEIRNLDQFCFGASPK